MNISFSKSFEKQLDSIPATVLKKGVNSAIKSIIEASKITQIPNIKKMKGHKKAYRIRVGDYRIGLFVEQGSVLVATLAHRKDIYKKFP